MTKEERLKEPRKFYEVYVHKELNKVVVNCGNELTEDEADGKALDFVLDDDNYYVEPGNRIAMWMSAEMVESLISHLYMALEKLKEAG